MRTALILVVLALTVFWLAIGMPTLVGYDQALADAAGTKVVVGPDGTVREYGYGLIRFNGKGPERWRWGAVTHYSKRRAVETDLGRTQRELGETRLELRRGFAMPTGHWLDGSFYCLHRFERGAKGWQTQTGNGFYGGLQMNKDFVNTYAPAWVIREFGWSPAGWPASIQIAVSMHAWMKRGFHPWPNTARRCGLL